jgi:phytoene dehydrogenase-like protein
MGGETLSKNDNADVIIIGSGHNGLVAATLLARKGLSVKVLEARGRIGGATITERPFTKVPGLGVSTGAYLLGVMPPELIRKLGLKVKLLRRDPHYFLPSTDRRFLLFGSDRAAMRGQFLEYFSEQDWRANEAFEAEMAQIREDFAPSWLEEPLSLEATAERYLRPQLRRAFLDLVTRPAEEYLARFGFRSQELIAMYVVTDGFSGLDASFGSPETGFNFLVHQMCRLPGADGTFMIVEGGMGALSGELARLAREAGATIEANAPVEKILTERGTVRGVALKDGRELKAGTVVANCDPYSMRDLVGAEALGAELSARLDKMKRMGTSMKVNFAFDRLPTFKCLPEKRGQHGATIHLLPQVGDVMSHIRKSYEQVKAGKLADFPTIEWYNHTTIDPTLRDEKGHQSAAFFIQWAPYELSGTTWEREEDRYVKHLFAIVDEFAPGFSASVVDTFTLTPPKIESHIGIRYGHIHHIDNGFAFDKRMPYATPVAGLYSCSAGCHPAGSVMGGAGHNAANRVLKDLGLKEEQ